MWACDKEHRLAHVQNEGGTEFPRNRVYTTTPSLVILGALFVALKA